MDWFHKEQSIESQAVRITELQHNFHAGLEYDFSVFDQKTNEFLLSARLARSRVPNKKALNIGYWTASNHCNKGLATNNNKNFNCASD